MRHRIQVNHPARPKAENLSQKGLLAIMTALMLWVTTWEVCLAQANANESPVPGLTNQISLTNWVPTREWKEVEGVVSSIRPLASGELEIKFDEGTNHFSALSAKGANFAPLLYSRIRVAGFFTSVTWASGRQVGEQIHLADLRQLGLVTGQICPLVTNAFQFAQTQRAGFPKELVVYLEGQILAVSPKKNHLIFQDASGAVLLDLDTRNEDLQPGRKIRLGSNAMFDNGRLVLRDPPVVDNDGYHTVARKSGSLYLQAGKRPIRLIWFNWLGSGSLDVFYQASDQPEQKIKDSVLFSPWTNPVTGQTTWTNGLAYRCAEGRWFQAPDFHHLVAVKEGKTSSFDLDVKSRTENVSMQFAGAIEVPHDGIYNFSTISDDGSLLYVDEHPPQIELGESAEIPQARRIVPGQIVRPNEAFQWTAVEGVVTYVSERADALTLDLSSSSGTMRIEVADSSGIFPSLLAHARIKVSGVSQPAQGADESGQQIAGILLTPGLEQIEYLELPAARWEDTPLMRISDCVATNPPPSPKEIVHIKGKARMSDYGKSVMLDDGTGQIFLETIRPVSAKNGDSVDALGCRSQSGTNLILKCVSYRIFPKLPDNGVKVLPLLTTTEQIKRLTREEAQLNYPVRLRGVVTAVIDTSFFLRDATGGIYARWNPNSRDNDIRVGDRWEIAGVTFAEFSPGVIVEQATFLSRGNLPEPLRPTWDRLMNGSLDAEYVEVQGVVVEIESNLLTLFSASGRVRLLMLDTQPQLLSQYLNALVRIRGCVNIARDVVTQQIDFGQIGLYNSQISLEEDAPARLSDVPLKHASELLFYDYRTATFHRARIAGQVIYASPKTCFLLDGTNSLRFVLKNIKGLPKLETGDLVEVVGFPELDDRSPVLVEAEVQRTGHAALPPALELTEAKLWDKKNDGRLVRIKGRVVNCDIERAEQTVELQIGLRRFTCRLAPKPERLSWIAPDSIVEVTGVYSAFGGDISSGPDVSSFELLLNSPADVQILARPSWWTLRHTLAILGVMAPIVFAAFVWIIILRRLVEKRTRQLAIEIQRHNQTERQRVVEVERSRIARDLHDALGAALTQIRFLSIRGSRAAQMPEKSRAQMARISEKSLEMVSSLDEIVWAVNPANDSLDKLVPYLCHIAEDFFNGSPIRCRLDVDENFPPTPLTSEVRHDLYLAVREVLTNIAKHSQASEVWFRINSLNQAINITIADNGHGFVAPESSVGDGLGNIRHRLEKMGGRFEYETHSGSGTVCRLWLPLATGA